MKHHANSSVLLSLLAGVWPNPIKLITMRCFLQLETLQLAPARVLHTEHRASGNQITARFSSCGESCYLLLLAPTEKATALFSGSAIPRRQPQRGYAFTMTKQMILTVILTETPTCRSPFIISYSGCFLQITFSHILHNVTAAEFHLVRSNTETQNFLLQRIPQTPSTQHL